MGSSQYFQNQQRLNPLSFFPKELFLIILSFLDIKTLITCCRVCHEWNKKITGADSIWFARLLDYLLQTKHSNAIELVSFYQHHGSTQLILKKIHQSKIKIEKYNTEIKNTIEHEKSKMNRIQTSNEMINGCVYLPNQFSTFKTSFFMEAVYTKVYRLYVEKKLKKHHNELRKILTIK